MAAAAHFPSNASNIPTQSKKGGIFSNSSRIQSLSATGSSTSISQGIGYSPGPSNTPPASSGIPAFRSLRSLLPFGPSKNTTPNASFAPSSPNTSKSPFASFGSARRSMQKDSDRKASLSSDVLRPVITIERNTSEEVIVRRSFSFSELEGPEQAVDAPSTPLHPNMSGMYFDFITSLIFPYYVFQAFALRTPSPGPPLSVELSTIMEADNSGVSKNPPSASSPKSSSPLITPHSSSLTNIVSNHKETTTEEETFALDLSTANVADQVRDAILSSDSSPNSVKQWRNADKAMVIIDADKTENLADTSLSLDNADPQLVALLSPNLLEKTMGKRPTLLQPSASPMIPFGVSPTRLPRARQASSFLPKLRPSTSSSPSAVAPKTSPAKGKTPIISINGGDTSAPSSPNSLTHLSVPTSSPVLASSRNLSLSRAGKLFTPDRSNSLSYSQTTAFGDKKDPSAQANPNVSPAVSKEPVRTLRRVVLGMTGLHANTSSAVVTPTPSPNRLATVGRASLDLHRPAASASEIGLGRPSLEIRRGNSFDSRRHASPSPLELRSSTNSERTESATTTATTPITEYSTPSLEMPYEESTFQRPSLDSTARPSLDSVTLSRPGSAAAKLLERERKTPSSHMFDSSSDRLIVQQAPRSRKRSMSVQERVGRTSRLVSGGPNVDVSETRPGSSLSVGRPSRGGTGVGEHGEKLSGSGPKLEWLGPRTIKAFRAAGLLDPNREKGLKERAASGNDALERLRERSGSVGAMLAPSPLGNNGGGPLSAPHRFPSLRGPADYNPGTRAQSRMAFSEVGGPSSRRGSESVSAYSGVNGFGLMESPTFTGSSGSRGERDTPKSASTAATSLSDTFGYFGRERDRERDRDREEIRELKDRHATEVAALLGALSDCQRTVRMLRDENSELRERLERFAGVLEANDELRQTCTDLRRECNELRRECAGLRREGTPVSYRSSSVHRAPGIAPSWSGGSGTSTNSNLRTAVPRLATSSPLVTDVTPRYEEEYNNTIIIHDSIDDRPESHQRRQFSDDDENHGQSPLDDLLPSLTSTPSAKRRHSNTSSIFPAPPSNMTMLLDDEGITLSSRSSADNSHFHFQSSRSPTSASSKLLSTPKTKSHSRSSSASSPPPVTFKDLSNAVHYPNQSVTSGVDISPTTAEFSMVTGSPRSLFLRPEHEQLLGDMESLDLGAIPPIDLGIGNARDDW